MAGHRDIAVVTGATSGIGRWIALGVARAGHRVVLVGRDRGRGDAAARWIAAHHPGAETEVEVADLSSVTEARALGERIAARHPRVSLLMNNAGVVADRRRVTPEGHELVIAVNHLAPFVLTRALEPALREAGAARVVNTGSSASDAASIRPDDLESERNWGVARSYAHSKLALLMASLEWARRLEGSGVTVNVAHPGIVRTKIAALPNLVGIAWTMAGPFMLSAQEGADTPVHVATSPAVAGVTGGYWKRRHLARPNRQAEDTGLRAQLWDATEQLVGSTGAAAIGEGSPPEYDPTGDEALPAAS